ncbi:MAG: zf-HC2 domain-containing protein, partial [Acidobacteriota bacterium]
MSNDSQHPGRSVTFLSRLHDGELSPSERARFEAHRAHCSECLRSAREFEESLSLFRSARSRPPSADLAARILRKVQAGPRRRAPFGVFFGIDPRWAAAAATVVFGLILGYAALDSGRESPRISVSLVTPSSADSSREAPVAAPVPELESAPPARAANPPARETRKL